MAKLPEDDGSKQRPPPAIPEGDLRERLERPVEPSPVEKEAGGVVTPPGEQDDI